jgi:hypothetical protein
MSESEHNFLPAILLHVGRRIIARNRSFAGMHRCNALKAFNTDPNFESGAFDHSAISHAERWVRGVRDECLSKLIAIGQRMLRRALREYGAYFHKERNHQASAMC